MSTTLNTARQELSRQLGDLWEGTTTGAGSSTTVVDTALKAKNNDWIDSQSAEMYDFITSATCLSEERRITSLDNSSGTLTVLAHTGTGPGTSATYEVHRLFTPSEKRTALIAACRQGFPYIHKKVFDESIVSGNWLKDGSLERWTTTTNLTDWTETTVTVTQTSTAGLYKHGSYSARLTVAAGSISQTISNFDDLKHLAGKAVTFTVQGHCNTASCLRISINDGTTETYSSYHAGNSAWTENDIPLEVKATIKDNPTAITFKIYHDVAAGTAYVDDARVISGERARLYIGHLGLQKNEPHQILVEPTDYYQGEPWILVYGYQVDKDGYLYLPVHVPTDRRLRIIGIGYLDFLASGVSSTAWTATVEVDSPQLDILVAEAALYLCRQKIMPTWNTPETNRWKEAYAFWLDQQRIVRMRFGMTTPAPTIHWSAGTGSIRTW